MHRTPRGVEAPLNVLLQSLAKRGVHAIACFILAAAFAPSLIAQETLVKFDPAKTTINFTLGATMHTVHGTFKLKSGEVRVDPARGQASGAIVVDATSANSDNSSRDQKMHKDVLESAKFPEIVFSPQHITADPGHTIREALDQKGRAVLHATGMFRIHGQDHEITLDLTVQDDGDGQLQISTAFPLPYVKWGLRNPSTFILRVSDSVDLEIHASAEIASGR